MLKFQYKGENYKFTFKHDNKHVYTRCTLDKEIKTNPQLNYWQELGTALATTSIEDIKKYEKDKGRRVALTRCLKVANQGYSFNCVAWLAYHNRKMTPFDKWSKKSLNGNPVHENIIKEAFEAGFDVGRRSR